MCTANFENLSKAAEHPGVLQMYPGLRKNRMILKKSLSLGVKTVDSIKTHSD